MKDVQIKITVDSDRLNEVLTAVRSAGFRHVELDQIEDAIEVSLNVLPGDVEKMMHVVQSAKPRAKSVSGYEALSEFASARPRNRDGQFVPMGERKGSSVMRKTGT